MSGAGTARKGFDCMNTTEENNVILAGWHRVFDGPAFGGDKYWDPKSGAWLPVTVNQHTMIGDYAAVIRRGG
jgi:hypothetical protein